MEKIKKNNKDLEKSGGTISSGKYDATAGDELDKDLDSKNKIIDVYIKNGGATYQPGEKCCSI